MNICIISSIGVQTYQGKYMEMKSEWAPFWDLAILEKGVPIDVVDYYLSKKGRLYNFNPDRHIYTNGIVLANRLYNPLNKIKIVNSIKPNFSFDNIDVAIISTNYVTANWIEHLFDILNELRKKRIKCIIGGIGIKKIYQNDKVKFSKIVNLIDGYIIISDSGLNKLKELFDNIFLPIQNKVIICDDEYDFNHKDYSLEHIDKSLHSKHTVLITQTGCIYDCAFCSYKDKNHTHSFFNMEEIKKALIELNRTNSNILRHVRFADETFNVDNLRVIELCNFIKSQDFKFRWSCFLRANNITNELIKALSMSGCDFVSIGVETGSPSLQKIMNKNIDLSDLKVSIAKLKNAGIVVNISLLVGFFGENETSIRETMKFISDSKPDLARINLWHPTRSEKNNYLFDHYQFRAMGNTWCHATLSEQDAVSFAKKLYLMDSDKVFFPPFSSVFDQWPVLASYDLSKREILNVFREYYLTTKNMCLNLVK